MKRDIKKQVEKARELEELIRKRNVYNQDYVIRNFTGHLEEAKAIRDEMLEEIEKLNVDIFTCISNIEERKAELKLEYGLINNIIQES